MQARAEARAREAAMREAGFPLLPLQIGRSVKVAEAAGAGQPVTKYDPSNPQAAAFQAVATLIDQWLRNRP